MTRGMTRLRRRLRAGLSPASLGGLGATPPRRGSRTPGIQAHEEEVRKAGAHSSPDPEARRMQAERGRRRPARAHAGVAEDKTLGGGALSRAAHLVGGRPPCHSSSKTQRILPRSVASLRIRLIVGALRGPAFLPLPFPDAPGRVRPRASQRKGIAMGLFGGPRSRHLGQGEGQGIRTRADAMHPLIVDGSIHRPQERGAVLGIRRVNVDAGHQLEARRLHRDAGTHADRNR